MRELRSAERGALDGAAGGCWGGVGGSHQAGCGLVSLGSAQLPAPSCFLLTPSGWVIFLGVIVSDGFFVLNLCSSFPPSCFSRFFFFIIIISFPYTVSLISLTRPVCLSLPLLPSPRLLLFTFSATFLYPLRPVISDTV